MRCKIVAVLVTAVLALAVSVSAASADPQASASGNGSLFAGTTIEQDFDFGASVGVSPFSADGHVHVTQPASDPNLQYKARVNCMVIVGNQAYMSGNITDISPAPNPATAPNAFIAYAQDNADPGDFQDRWQFFVFNTASPPNFGTGPVTNCVAATAVTFLGAPISNGDINVNPL